MRKGVKILVAAAAAAVIATVIAASAGGSRPASEPGLTSKSILLGGVFPLTGSASAYGTIAKAEQAYFNWWNDTHGGVYGRKIEFKIYDDGYIPAQAAQYVRQLVQQDHVFACFQNLGTEPNLAIRDFLQAQHVPNLFVATGASEWGIEWKKYNYMLGYNPDYYSEGVLYGKFIRAKVPQAKVGILMQDDAYGKDLLAGFRKGLAGAGARIVNTQAYQITDTDMASYVSKLKASGANVWMDFATPSFSVRSLVTAAKLGWKPTLFVNNVSSANFLMVAAAKAGASALTEGSISAIYSKDPSDPKWQNDSAIKRYRAIMAKYYPSGTSTAWASPTRWSRRCRRRART
jgi:branched-chain amino acid transport system substrate-binding protein